MNLRSGWLRGTLFATALTFVTAPVLAATDDIVATNFLLDNGMEVVVTARPSSPMWCGTRSAAPTSRRENSASRIFSSI